MATECDQRNSIAALAINQIHRYKCKLRNIRQSNCKQLEYRMKLRQTADIITTTKITYSKPMKKYNTM